MLQSIRRYQKHAQMMCLCSVSTAEVFRRCFIYSIMLGACEKCIHMAHLLTTCSFFPALFNFIFSEPVFTWKHLARQVKRSNTQKRLGQHLFVLGCKQAGLISIELETRETHWMARATLPSSPNGLAGWHKDSSSLFWAHTAPICSMGI